MYIIEVTERFRNNFHFIAYCRYCGKKSTHGDGYADEYYQKEVFPNRHCEEIDCGKDEFGKTFEEKQIKKI